MTILDDIEERLREHIAGLRADLERAETALHALKTSGQMPATPTASGSSTSNEGKKSITRSDPKPEQIGLAAGSRRKFTEEEKADAVDRALEIGSWSSAADELGIHQSVLRKWKREGFGGSGGGSDGKTLPGNKLPAHLHEDLRR